MGSQKPYPQTSASDCRSTVLALSLTIRFRPPSATVVSAEPFSHGTGTLRCLQKEMATYRHWSVSLWRDPDDVSHCRILSPDKTEWRLISATLCGWGPIMVNDTHTRRRSINFLFLLCISRKSKLTRLTSRNHNHAPVIFCRIINCDRRRRRTSH